MWAKHYINQMWTGYSDSQWLKISRTKSNYNRAWTSRQMEILG